MLNVYRRTSYDDDNKQVSKNREMRNNYRSKH